MSIGVQTQLYTGMQETYTRLITEGENALYAGLTGDSRQQIAPSTTKGEGVVDRPPANPLYLVGIIGGLLNTRLPGEGSACITMQYEFLAPVRCGDRIEMVIELTGLDVGKHLATFRTNCYNQEKHQVIAGQAVMLVPGHMLP